MDAPTPPTTTTTNATATTTSTSTSTPTATPATATTPHVDAKASAETAESTPPTASEGGLPGPSADPPTLFECPNANEEPCDTGRQCYNSKLRCDGGQPDCADGSDESTVACTGLEIKAGDAKDDASNAPKDAEPDGDGGNGGGSDTMMWGIIGAVVGVGTCGVFAYLYINMCSRKTGGDIKTYSQTFGNLAYSKESADGELYGSAGPNNDGAAPSSAIGDESYADIDGPGAIGDESYEEIGPVGGRSHADATYTLRPAAGPPKGQGVYDTDFATSSTVRQHAGDCCARCAPRLAPSTGAAHPQLL